MALLLRMIWEGYTYMHEELADPRTSDWPFMKSMLGVMGILAVYLVFILKTGPAYMKNRPAYKLETTMMLYDIVQVAICFYISVQTLRLTYLSGYSFACQPVDFSDDPVAIQIAWCAWLYFFTKLMDLMDTVFFVLRKKQNQVTFLHLYHHTGMVMLAWFGVKFLPGGHGMAICVVNCFVHSVMYLYYFLTAMKPEWKSNPWWKKYITQMQLFQFLMMTLHFGQLALQPQCGYPRFTAAAFVPQNFFMLMLFSDFYYRAYLKRKPEKKA